MAAATSLETLAPPSEQRMLLRNVSWKEYVLLRDVLDGPGLRMTYAAGILELMSPSPEHELWKTNIARLVELFAHLRRIDLRGYGSTTFKKEARERGAEPDECYLVGKRLADFPEIVLDVYAAFGVPEVWVFRNAAFTIHALDPNTGSYRGRSDSALLPELDFALVARLALREDTPQALRELESALRESPSR